ncbi:endolytic transglycosylase MltG [Candidatus Woesebacteria bacterium]|nr:endolytic transglycosylase MltG [Candidatus Woesebacteria bacterium]
MKRLVLPIIFIFILIAALLFGFLWWKENSKAPSTNSEVNDFLIVKGSAASDVANRLFKEGYIKNPLAFKLYIQFKGMQSKIQAGAYLISRSYTLQETINQLSKGPTELWVTIPEGLRREEIVEKFIKGLNPLDVDSFRVDFLESSKGMEGYLFPDTYLFPKTVTGAAVAKKMRNTFDTLVTPQMKSDSEKLGIKLDEIVTMASIIERETNSGDERPIVAGILYKRIKSRWPLQVDATLEYGLSNTRCITSQGTDKNCKWWQPVTHNDLTNNNSLYNTYKHQGLPPTPIANPGLVAIKAAIHPKDSPYWYYLHGQDGIIHYAVTVQEHNQNINKYLN